MEYMKERFSPTAEKQTENTTDGNAPQLAEIFIRDPLDNDNWDKKGCHKNFLRYRADVNS